MDTLTTDRALPRDEVLERLDRIIALLQPPLTEVDVRRIVQNELQLLARKADGRIRNSRDLPGIE